LKPTLVNSRKMIVFRTIDNWLPAEVVDSQQLMLSESNLLRV
jgi:hypothetical protein